MISKYCEWVFQIAVSKPERKHVLTNHTTPQILNELCFKHNNINVMYFYNIQTPNTMQYLFHVQYGHIVCKFEILQCKTY